MRYHLLIATVLVGTTFQVEAQTYTYVDLGVTPYSDTFATSIWGDVQGGYGLVGGQPQALIWKDTPASAVTLPSTGYQSTQATGLVWSTAAGSGVTTSGQTVGLFWNSLTAAPVNLNPSFAGSSVVNGLSATTSAAQAEEQVGSAIATGSGQQVAVRWTGTAASAQNINPSGASSSQAYASASASIGEAGSAVFSGATHAIYWNRLSGTSTPADLNPTGALRSEALAISFSSFADFYPSYGVGEAGDYTTSSGAVHACYWLGTAASIVDLHPSSGYTSTVATGLYTIGETVQGTSPYFLTVGYGAKTNGTTVPLLWTGTVGTPGQNIMTDLSTYMPAGTTSARALAIDPLYQTISGVATINGSNHAFVLGITGNAFLSAPQNLSTFVGVPYSYQVVARGFPFPTYSATKLPPGLSISSTTGLISGTPTQTGSYSGLISTPSRNQACSITVVAAPPVQMSIVGSFAPANGTGLHEAMVMGADGSFYGTSTTGGAGGAGTVYKMTPDGTQSTLHAFGDGSVLNDGAEPEGLTFGSDGALYGTTFAGGSAGKGTIFKISQGTTTILHHFGDGSVPHDGANPATSMTLGTDGNFYGVTTSGGSASSGTLFSMTPSGTVSILHTFDSATGSSSPDTPLTAASGSPPFFYETVELGDRGTAYYFMWPNELGPIHSFDMTIPPILGFRPHGPMITSSNGAVLYGIASAGGTSTSYNTTGDPTNPLVFGLGTIYQLAGGAQTDLHNFGDGTVGNDGANTADPNAGLILGVDGNLYGVTPAGGSANQDCLIQDNPASTVKTFVLHSFGDGTTPNDGLVPGPVFFQGTDGYYYGVTEKGGAYGNGVIYKFFVGVVPVLGSSLIPSEGYTNVPYSYTFTAAAFPAAMFAVTSGSLPPGLILSSGGVLSGTPTTFGSYSFNITASNSVGNSPGTAYKILVFPSKSPVITNGPPGNGVVAAAYSFSYTATGTPTPTFSVTAGALPPGLTLSQTGVISGKPTVAGIYTGTVTVDNQNGSPATQNFSITIAFNYSSWVAQYNLTGGNAAATAIVSPDGLPNLVKYSLGLSPLITYNPGATGLPSVQMTTNPTGPQSLTLSFNGSAADVTYNVQATSDLNAGWTTIATFPSGGTAPGQQTVQDSQDITVSPKRFMRLQVTSP